MAKELIKLFCFLILQVCLAICVYAFAQFLSLVDPSVVTVDFDVHFGLSDQDHIKSLLNMAKAILP